MAAQGGTWRHMAAHGGTGRHMAAQGGTWRHMAAQGGTWRHRAAQGGTGRHRAAHGGTGRHRAAHGGTWRHRAAQGGTGRHARTPVHNCPLLHRAAADLAVAPVHNHSVLVPGSAPSFQTQKALPCCASHSLHHAEATARAGPHAAQRRVSAVRQQLAQAAAAVHLLSPRGSSPILRHS
jgi:hypothetical protein